MDSTIDSFTRSIEGISKSIGKNESVEVEVEAMIPLVEAMERQLRSFGAVPASKSKLEVAATELWNALTLKMRAVSMRWMVRAKFLAALAVSISGDHDRALHCMLRVVECGLEYELDATRAMDSADWLFDKCGSNTTDYYTAKIVVALKKGEHSAARMYMGKFDPETTPVDEQRDMTTQVYNACVHMDSEEWVTKLLEFECIEPVQINCYRLLAQSPEKAPTVCQTMQERFPTAIETYLTYFECMQGDYENMLMRMVFQVGRGDEKVITWLYNKLHSQCDIFPSLDHYLTMWFSPLLFVKRLQLTNEADAAAKFLDLIERKLVEPLPQQCVETAVLVLWKKNWLQLCLHQLFANLGQVTKAKVQRRLMDRHAADNNYAAILDVYNEMVPSAQLHPYTQAHTFKHYCHCNDVAMAVQCMTNIANSNSPDRYKLLAFCISHSRDTQTTKQVTFQGMKMVLDVLEESDGVNIPALVRAAVQMSDHDRRQQLQVLQRGVKFKYQPNDYTWLGNKCYKVARQLAKHDPTDELIPQFCTVGFEYLHSLNLLLVHLYHLAHCGTNEAASKTRELVHQARQFELTNDQIKLRLIVYQLSAITILEEYDEVPELCRELVGIKAHGVECAVNILLTAASSSEATKGISMVLSDQVMAQRDLRLVSKWVRVFVGVAIHNQALAVQPLLDQLIARLRVLGAEEAVESEEIRWIATACWNYGVELVDQQSRDDGLKWCQLALKFSAHVDGEFKQDLESCYLDL